MQTQITSFYHRAAHHPLKTALMGLPLLGLSLLSFAGNAHAQDDAPEPPPVMSTYPGETPAQHAARMKWFHEARFGMFIHWGVYSVPAGVYKDKRYSFGAEWIMNFAKIPCAEYRTYGPLFTAGEYDPEAWVKMAKDAGMKYIVITTKHHEGFALFDSKVTTWDAVDEGGAHRDLLRPLVEAAHKAGLKIGFYYSQAQDWNHQGGSGNNWDPTQKGDMDEYLKNIALPQVKELLTNYGPVDVFWWDTAYGMNRERAAPFAALLQTQPGIISNNRLGGGFKGDTETPEGFIPGQKPDRDFEVCMNINNTWGYSAVGKDFKSSTTLIHNLIDIASKGGNYLLNVGPTKEGNVPQAEIDRLKAVGTWMKVNGDAIYATDASPLGRQSWGRVTQKQENGATTLYLHVFDWPHSGKLRVPGLLTVPTSAHVLVGNTKIKSVSDTNGITLTLPKTAPDPVSSTLVLQFKGVPRTIILPVSPDAEGILHLPSPDAAEISGKTLKTGDNLSYWTNPDDYVSWKAALDKPGTYEVSADLSATDATAIEFKVGDQTLRYSVAPTGSYDKYTSTVLGRMTLPTGAQTFELHAVKDGWHPTNVKNLQIKLVKG